MKDLTRQLVASTASWPSEGSNSVEKCKSYISFHFSLQVSHPQLFNKSLIKFHDYIIFYTSVIENVV